MIADLTSNEDVKRLIDTTISKFGRLDILVNNAGIVGTTDIEDSDVVVKFDKIMETNVRPVVELCRLAVPHLKKTKGNIVNRVERYLNQTGEFRAGVKTNYPLRFFYDL